MNTRLDKNKNTCDLYLKGNYSEYNKLEVNMIVSMKDWLVAGEHKEVVCLICGEIRHISKIKLDSRYWSYCEAKDCPKIMEVVKE